MLVHNTGCELNKPSGTYDIKVSKNGKIQNYVGKGTEQRMRRSMSRLRKQGYEILSDGAWKSSLNSKTAFVDEYMRMAQYDFDFGGKLVNKIMSPGAKIFELML